MRIRAAAALAALVALSACSSPSVAAPTAAVSNTTTSVAASTTAPGATCIDFAEAAFIGQSALRSVDVASKGWSISYLNANPNGTATADSSTAKIVSVSKVSVRCEVVFTLDLSAPPEPTKPPEPAGISEGTYLVGTDMEPGSYKTTGAEGCYWARLKDDAGRNIIANNLSDGPMRFTVKKGEYLQISGACVFTKV